MEPITDLQAHERAAASAELPALATSWAEVRETLDKWQIDDFNERLKREWAIETGIIEQLYTLDRGTTELLIQQGLDASRLPSNATDQPPDLVIGMIRDHADTVDWLFDAVTERRPLSTSFLKELHQFMTRKQSHATGVNMFGTKHELELRHGAFKMRSNNPVRPDGALHEYCPPEHVDAEIDRLLEMHRSHVAEGLAPDVSAAWLHHRFAQIHPFEDGNGRVARAIASLVLMGAGWFPLVVTRDDRDRYIRALERADDGELTDLIDLFGVLEGKWFRKAITIATEVEHSRAHMDQMLDAISEMFTRGGVAGSVELRQAIDVAESLRESCSNRFNGLRDDLRNRIGARFGVEVWTDTATNEDLQRRVWFRHQVVDTARELDYFANQGVHHEWVRLNLRTESGRSEILVSFHGIGREYRGLVGASMCFYRKQAADADAVSDAGVSHAPHAIERQAVTDEVFQINHVEELASVERRFEKWLERGLVAALDQWRRGE